MAFVYGMGFSSPDVGTKAKKKAGHLVDKERGVFNSVAALL